jgi:hypothetical protein
MTTPKPTHEWRLNFGLSDKVYKGYRFHDLFVGDEYQHIWLRETLSTGKFELARSGMADYIGEFDSIQEVEDHMIVLDVINRFEQAYG